MYEYAGGRDWDVLDDFRVRNLRCQILEQIARRHSERYIPMARADSLD